MAAPRASAAARRRAPASERNRSGTAAAAR
jgi:hypothetical protein